MSLSTFLMSSFPDLEKSEDNTQVGVRRELAFKGRERSGMSEEETVWLTQFSHGAG